MKQTLDDIRDDTAARSEATIADVCATEAKVKETLNICGVSTSLYILCLLV